MGCDQKEPLSNFTNEIGLSGELEFPLAISQCIRQNCRVPLVGTQNSYGLAYQSQEKGQPQGIAPTVNFSFYTLVIFVALNVAFLIC